MPRKKKETDAAKEVQSVAVTEDKASHHTEIENSLEAAGDDSLVNENSQADIEKNRMTSPGRSEGALDDNLSQTDFKSSYD